MTVGFIGIGTMGLPMARALLDAGTPLLVWNRTPGKCLPLVELGAQCADSVDALCERASVVLLILLNEQAVDETLGRGTPAFRSRMAGRTVVQLGTTSPAFSRSLGRDISECGGSYVEAPVSGSRVPAEQGRLVGMVAGHPETVASVLPLLEPLCREIFHCGEVPQALRMKLAVNHYLIATVTALAEAVHAAERVGLDLSLLRDILDAGPMASEISRTKLGKLVARDFQPQAAIGDVSTIADLVLDQAMLAQAHAPLIAECATMYRSAAMSDQAALDMAAVVMASTAGSSQKDPDKSDRALPTALRASDVPSRTRASNYPQPFAARLGIGRDKKALGDAFGLRNFGVNLTRLAPGAVSALKHAHSRQDEFIYVLQGTPVLHAGDQRNLLGPGMCAGFRYGTGIAHQLVNESADDVVYLEIGDRSRGDIATYPDEDLMAFAGNQGWRFFRSDGSPC